MRVHPRRVQLVALLVLLLGGLDTYACAIVCLQQIGAPDCPDGGCPCSRAALPAVFAPDLHVIGPVGLPAPAAPFLILPAHGPRIDHPPRV